jgi:hypothetical protein
MIRASAANPTFKQAWSNARRALPIEQLETPRQYSQRWREVYRCRPDCNSDSSKIYYVFDRDADYTWFMLKWGS